MMLIIVVFDDDNTSELSLVETKFIEILEYYGFIGTSANFVQLRA